MSIDDVPEAFSLRPGPAMREELAALLPLYADRTDAIRAAVHALYVQVFGEAPRAPIIGYDPIVLARPAVCAETGVEIPAGAMAYREVHEGGGYGDIVSRAALVADGVLE